MLSNLPKGRSTSPRKDKDAGGQFHSLFLLRLGISAPKALVCNSPVKADCWVHTLPGSDSRSRRAFLIRCQGIFISIPPYTLRTTLQTQTSSSSVFHSDF